MDEPDDKTCSLADAQDTFAKSRSAVDTSIRRLTESLFELQITVAQSRRAIFSSHELLRRMSHNSVAVAPLAAVAMAGQAGGGDVFMLPRASTEGPADLSSR
jgi:hypothetical protein